jgi:hypothetical protein
MARYKVLSVEVDGVESDVQTELPLDADRVFFDNTGTSFTATDVRSAIIQAQTGSVTPDNFSYKSIQNKTILIPEDQQMTTFFNISLLDAGQLVIDGELILFS